MPGDKLKRVKSIKRWLDKAEDSYTNNQDISGELNLIMAQAEMQRLKETHPHENAKKWIIRFSSMAVAVILFMGINSVFPFGHHEAPVVSEETMVVREEIPVLPMENNVAEPEIIQSAAVAEQQPVESPPQTSVRAEMPVSVTPIMSQSEIQSVVGEAGRALRGQS